MTADAQLISSIQQTLESDISLGEELIALLQQETQLLRDRKFIELSPLAAKKQALIDQVHQNQDTKLSLLKPFTHSIEQENAFAAFLKTCNPTQTQQLQKTNEKVAKTLEEVSRLNNINGQVISTNLQNQHKLQQLLQGQSEQTANVYNANGQISKNGAGAYNEEI